MTDLAGRAIALTGAGSGIGRALAVLLARKGVRLALADKDAAGLAATRALLGNAPATTTVLDVTDHDALGRWIDEAAREFGGLPHLRRSDAAWIVNLSSVFGMMGYPTQSAYNASKFAVRGLTEALYLELGQTDPHIRVIRVHPGGIKTNVARNAKFIKGMPGSDSALDSGDAFEKNARTTPEAAAAAIVAGMEAGRHRVLIGPDARLIDWLTRLFPVDHYRRIGAFLGR